MLISVEELKKHITTTLEDSVLEEKLQALELSIRKYTNNNFQRQAFRCTGNIASGVIEPATTRYFKAGDTIQISEAPFNEGLYVIQDITEGIITVDKDVYDEDNVLITKIEYPFNVKMGAVDIMKWKLKNEAVNSGDTSKKEIQSETISRHSVTYAQDASESDIDVNFGVPKKYTAFLKAYRKVRF